MAHHESLVGNKWTPGSSYGPVLSQTDLYLLKPDLEIHPILTNQHSFHLSFNLVTGQTSGDQPNMPFDKKDEPATMPRVTQLYIITKLSPWCTVVTNERGVTMADVCTTIWKDYAENFITETELGILPLRVKDQVKRAAMHNTSNAAPNSSSQWYYPSAPPSRFKRVDWLRERIYFDGLQKNDGYVESRLGFKAPNIFVMDLVA
ncbi:hypothetical protein AMATHDRAFT_1209 [Amanita thiersii Skay4041]|uniref:DUF6699 domain-containing protein n=1 Tax=Amanita thiersii Skay4041 TaxID=703135 RepID=A0A2A9NYI1_9AGAR|nr:hypothetical protein AMATHDRAFT_1209 [Amanita thiersii Skay4041]